MTAVRSGVLAAMAHSPVASTEPNLEQVLVPDKPGLYPDNPPSYGDESDCGHLVMDHLKFAMETCFTLRREPGPARAAGDRIRLHPVDGAGAEPVPGRPGRTADPGRAGGGRAGAAPAALLPVGPEGTVLTWTWMGRRLAGQPLDRPFGWALIRLDGADTGLLH